MTGRFLLDVRRTGEEYLTAADVRYLHIPGTELKFKVEGENRFVAVINGSADEATNVIIVRMKERNIQVDIQCTPLIPYETFARQSLAVTDDEIAIKGKMPPFQVGKEAYWVEFSIDSVGTSLERLAQTWHDEAVLAMNLTYSGEQVISLFKCVFMKKVLFFVEIDAVSLDKLLFELPIVKGLGDQIQTSAKRVSLQQ